MADLERIEQVKAEAMAARLGQQIADDVLWMARRMFDPVPGMALVEARDNPMVADTRYTRLLRVLADRFMTSLEDEVGP